MSLSAADVAEIMRLVEQSSFDELTLEMDGLKLTLRREGASGGVTKTLVPLPAGAEGAVEAAAESGAKPDMADPRASSPAAAPEPAETGLHDIASPMLGTFYRAPKPGSAPFVEIGSAVAEDTVIGIIEVMKLMNSVSAGMRGVVTHVFVENGHMVEFGQSLVAIRPE